MRTCYARPHSMVERRDLGMHNSFRHSTTSSQDLQLAAQGSPQDTKKNLLLGDIPRKAPTQETRSKQHLHLCPKTMKISLVPTITCRKIAMRYHQLI